MKIYLDMVMLLNFLVDFCLLLAANRLAGYPQSYGRCAVAAGVGGVYAGACLLPRYHFLGGTLWRIVSLSVMSMIAFGWQRSSMRKGVLFILLSMALGGIAMGLGNGRIGSLAVGAALLLTMCAVGFHGGIGTREYVSVELRRGEKCVRLLALKDTGNTLRDPVTGQSVLVADWESASALMGLTRQQVSNPVETVAAGILPGLRLIPYRAVGQSGGMLLAIRLEDVKIGNWRGSTLVAFAPEGLGGKEAYRALTGGFV